MRKYGIAVVMGAVVLLSGASAAHASDDTPEWANPASDAGTEIVQLRQDSLQVTVKQLDAPDSLPFDVTHERATASQHLFNVVFENTGTGIISISNTPEVYVYPAGTTDFTAENRQSLGWSDIGQGQGDLQAEFFEEHDLNRFALRDEGLGELSRWSGSGVMGGWLPLQPGQKFGYGLLSIDDGEQSKVFELSLISSDFLSDEFHLLPADADGQEAGEGDA